MLDLEDNVSPKMPFWTQHTQFHFSSFSSFQPYFQATLWRPSWAWISSHLVSLERSRFLVSIGPDLAWFGAIVVEILCMEGEVTQCRKFNSTILGKFISPNPEQILRSHFFGKYMTHHTSICFRCIAPFVTKSVHFIAWNGPKTALFT